MRKAYGSRELVKCLQCLGFSPKPQRATSHIKYIPPRHKKINPNIRPFLIVQLGRKTYDPHAQTRYIRQIMNFSFSKEEIENCF